MTAAGLESRKPVVVALVALQLIGAPGLVLAQEVASEAEVTGQPSSAAPGTAVEAAADGVDPEALATGVEAEASEPPAPRVDLYQVGATTLDVALLRPLGALTLLGGVIFFAASVPFVAPSDHIVTTWDTFVYSPYDYAVRRPLGEIF